MPALDQPNLDNRPLTVTTTDRELKVQLMTMVGEPIFEMLRPTLASQLVLKTDQLYRIENGSPKLVELPAKTADRGSDKLSK